MAKECGDGVDAHAAVDGLSGQGVSELVRSHVSDACVVADAGERRGDSLLRDRSALLDEQSFRSQACGSVVGDPVVEQGFQVRMQGNVSVTMQFSDRNA